MRELNIRQWFPALVGGPKGVGGRCCEAGESMGRREENDPKQATAPRECGQWRGTSEFRVGGRGLPAALAAYLNQKPSLTPGEETEFDPEGSKTKSDPGGLSLTPGDWIGQPSLVLEHGGVVSTLSSAV